MKTEKIELKKLPFDVHIPNLEGDGIAYTIKVEVQAYTDPETGEDVLTPESLELIEKTQARHMGLMSAEEIAALRARLALSQDEMSSLLQIGAKTYTRWESGRARPSRSMNVLLCALRDGQLSLNYLRALRNPSAHAVWASHLPDYDVVVSCLASAAWPLQSEAKPAGPHFLKCGPTEVLSAWQHLWQIEGLVTSIPACDHITLNDALLKDFSAQSAEGSEPTLSAPRLPSARHQRQTFMCQRFDLPLADDTVSG